MADDVVVFPSMGLGVFLINCEAVTLKVLTNVIIKASGRIGSLLPLATLLFSTTLKM